MTNDDNDQFRQIEPERARDETSSFQFGRHIDQSLTSQNQAGGVTARTVHQTPSIGPLSPSNFDLLVSNLSRDEVVQILVTVQDRVVNQFARQLVERLAQADFKVAGVERVTPAVLPPPGVHLDKVNNRIIVGPAP